MGKPSAPKPPDPQDTSKAQTGTNIGTAIANTMMGNVNTFGPQGNLTYDQTGNFDWTDPYTDKTYSIPQFTATTQLSPDQQQIFDQQQQAQLGMMTTANQQTDRLQNLLGQDFQPSNLPGISGMPGGQMGQDVRSAGMPGPAGSQDVRSNPMPGPVGQDVRSNPIPGPMGQDVRSNPIPGPVGQDVRSRPMPPPGSQDVRSRPNPGFRTQEAPSTLSPSPQGGQIGVPGQSQFERQQGDAGLIDRGARGGSIQRGVDDPRLIDRDARGGRIQSGVQGQRFDTSAPQGGGIQRGVGQVGIDNRAAQGGDITRSYGANDFSADRQRVEDALMERMQPHIDRDRDAMETRLANQGIGAGARAYGAMQDDFSRGVNDARLGAVLSAGQEQQRMVGMDADRAQFQNQAQQQAFGQDFSNIGQQAQIGGQQFGQNLAAGQFGNQAQQQAFGQDATALQMQNAARQQQLQGDIAAGQFGNQAQQQAFGQDATNIAQRNAARGQQFQQGLGAGQFANQAQQQAFGQDMANIQAQNAARQAGFDNQFRATAANNQNMGQLFGQGMQRLGAQSDLRSQALQEQLAMRNQPINEITALMSGSQVSMPNFQRNQPTPIPTTDNAGLINQNYQQQFGNYQQQMGQWNNTMGGLFGMGAAFLSDRRLKRDVLKIGERDGLNLYEYRYLWDAPGTVRRGFMAQEVIGRVPDAVLRVGRWLALDYAKLPEVS